MPSSSRSSERDLAQDVMEFCDAMQADAHADDVKYAQAFTAQRFWNRWRDKYGQPAPQGKPEAEQLSDDLPYPAGHELDSVSNPLPMKPEAEQDAGEER